MAAGRTLAWRRAGIAGCAICLHATLAQSVPGAATNDVVVETSLPTIQSVLNDLPPPGEVPFGITWPALRIHSWTNGVTVYGLRSEMRLGYAFAVFPPARAGEGTLLTITAPRLYINSRTPGRKNGMGAVFFFQIGPNGTELSQSGMLISTNLSERLGQSVANVDDMNGDGFVDLVVGAPDHIDSKLQGGIWQLFNGPGPWGVTNSAKPLVSLSPHHGARKGFCVASAGDVNGDGRPDLLVGVPYDNFGNGREGGALLHLGSTNGVNLTPDWAARGFQRASKFGGTVASAGDVNADGFDDILIAAPEDSSQQPFAGRVALYLGSPTGPGDKADWTMMGPVATAFFGDAMSALGDINGDGFDDVILGAPGAEHAASDWPGAAYIFLGCTNGLSQTPAVVLRGESARSMFGGAFATRGDVDGDHRPDLFIGSPKFSRRDANGGRVYLFPGRAGGFASHPSWVLDGGKADATCGDTLAFVRDVNGDGCDEILVGSPLYGVVTKREGRADLFLTAPNRFRSADFDPDLASTSGKTNGLDAPELNPSVEGNRSAAIDTRHSKWPWLAAGLLALAGMGAWHLSSRRAVAGERQRLARELHDDLGSQLTHISALTEMVRRESTHTEAGKQHAQLLSKAAQEVLESMEEVIWSVNPANDTLENLVIFIIQYAGPFLAPSGIELNPESPTSIPNRRLTAELRKNVFLSVKEALNNVVKHSQARCVDLRITCDASALTIVIADDGKGLGKPEGTPNGPSSVTHDGLKNIQARMTEVRGSFSIEDRPEGGTRVTLRIPL